MSVINVFKTEIFETAPYPGIFFSSSASDAEFDAVVGYLEDIIMGKLPCHNQICACQTFAFKETEINVES